VSAELSPTPAEQRRRFAATARELGIPDTEAAQERAFGKVGLRKRPKQRRKKQGSNELD
jgi:hypothetical protein